MNMEDAVIHEESISSDKPQKRFTKSILMVKRCKIPGQQATLIPLEIEDSQIQKGNSYIFVPDRKRAAFMSLKIPTTFVEAQDDGVISVLTKFSDTTPQIT
ncbi:MAG: hypothetical protein GY861_15120 [bacterium]|nr:hypothetical protein [bacterium]